MDLEVREDDYIELEEQRALVYLPKKSIEAKLIIKVYIDGRTVDVYKTLDVEELREAFNNGSEWFVGDEDTFALTEKGKELIGELKGLKD